ncbi:hypothetical protein KC324_g11 [Hortaea werneckii]|nr:hypothetical protein KC324_g11 [Hortaea werneckii]
MDEERDDRLVPEANVVTSQRPSHVVWVPVVFRVREPRRNLANITYTLTCLPVMRPRVRLLSSLLRSRISSKLSMPYVSPTTPISIAEVILHGNEGLYGRSSVAIATDYVSYKA